MQALQKKLLNTITDNNAYSCTKAYFHPHLDKEKKSVYTKKSSTTNRASRLANTPKIQTNDKYLIKLLDRAVKSSIDAQEVAKKYSCLVQLFKQELALNEENVNTLQDLVNANYPSESKASKLPIFGSLVLLINGSKDNSYYPQLLALGRSSLSQIQALKKENPLLEEFMTALEDALQLVLEKGNNLDQKIQIAKYSLFVLVLCILAWWIIF